MTAPARAVALGAASLVLSSVLALVLGGCASGGSAPGAGPPPSPPGSASVVPTPSTTPSGAPAGRPLRGRVVVLDPGHQLGNRHFASKIGRTVDAGGFHKECNTTGTATADGYPEATFAWQVAVEARRLLERLGARVVLTRGSDSDERWGPCVDERGRIGNPGEPGPTADLRISLHADGVLAGSAHGFHVIAPEPLAGWTDDIARPSRRLALALRDSLVAAGFAPSSYTGRRGLVTRGDLGTLNWSDVPAVMAELGNMRDPRDAAVMESADGRRRYAQAVAEAARAWLSARGRQG